MSVRINKTVSFIIAALLCASAHVFAQDAEAAAVEAAPPAEQPAAKTQVEAQTESIEESAAEAAAQPVEKPVAETAEESPQKEPTEENSVESGVPSTEEQAVETPEDEPELELEPMPERPLQMPSIEEFRARHTESAAAELAEEPEAVDSTSASKPRIAVYVTGDGDAVRSRALATYILNAIAATDIYTPVERSEVFLAEITGEQIKQRSGAIDDSQISRLGKQSGVQFVCVADITQAMAGNKFQVSARILNVESAEVAAVGVATSRLNTMNDLQKASEDVVKAMFTKLNPNEQGRSEADQRKVKFGGRVAYNNSYITKMNLKTVYYDNNWQRHEENYAGKTGLGHGFEVSAVTVVCFTDDASINIAPGFIFRTPYVSDAASISEFAVSIPALFEWRLFRSPVCALGGLQADIPINTKTRWDGKDEAEPLDARSNVDVGVVLGINVHIGKKLALDVRGCLGLKEFSDGKDNFLNQVSVGVSYVR